MSDKTIPTINANSSTTSGVLNVPNTPIQNSSMTLVEEDKGAAIRTELEIKPGQLNKIQADAGKKYRVVSMKKIAEKDVEQLQDQVVAVRHEQDLQLSYPNGTIVELAGFYQVIGASTQEASTMTLPGEGEGVKTLSSDGSTAGATETVLSPNTTFLYAHGDQATLAQMTQGNNALANVIASDVKVLAEAPGGHTDAVFALFGLVGAGAGIAILATPHGGSSSTASSPATPATPAVLQTTLSGDVVAGPVVSGNNLKVFAFKADGTALNPGGATVDASGHYSLAYDASYTGAVLLKVIDKNPAIADYMNEATGIATSLNSNIYAIVVPTIGGASTVNITPLTSLAAKLIGINAGALNAETGDSISYAHTSAAEVVALAVHIASVNNAVAKEFAGATGTEQITALTPVTTISVAGEVNPLADAYGKSLADISSMESAAGKTTTEVLDKLLAGLVFVPSTSSVQVQANLSPLLQKAIISESTGTTNLSDHLMSLVEATSPTVIHVELSNAWTVGYSVELLLGGVAFGGANTNSAPKIVVLTATDVNNGFVEFNVVQADLGSDGSKSITAVAKDASGFSGFSSNAISFALDTIALAPVVNAVATDNIVNLAESTGAITGSNEAGASVDLLIGTHHRAATVTGTSWTYTLVAEDITTLGQGAAVIVATQTDAAGNVSTTTDHAIQIDTVAPTASATVSTASVVGSNAHAIIQSSEIGVAYLVKDNLTPVTIAGITGSQDSWWNSVQITSVGTDVSISTVGLADGTYHLYSADAAGNLSTISTQAVTVDAIAPTVTAVAISSTTAGHAGTDLVAGDHLLATLTMSEAVSVAGTPTYQIDIGGVLHDANYISGSGTDSLVFSYTVATGDYDVLGGITAAANALHISSGGATSITDIAGNPANAASPTVNVGSNSVHVDTTTSVLTNSSAFGVTNLDVTSDIVLKFDSAVTATTNGHISLINEINSTSKSGYLGESSANNIELYFGASTDLGATTSVQTYSDASKTIASGTISIDNATGAVTINPLHDLDLSNNYHVVIAADSFTKTYNGLANLAIGADSSLHFSTVTAGAATSSGSIASAAASSVWNFDGTVSETGHAWVSIEGLGADGALVSLDAASKNYAFVLQNVSTNSDPLLHEAAVNSTYVNLKNFNMATGGDIIYFDQQNNLLNGLMAPTNIGDGVGALVPLSSPLDYLLTQGSGGTGGPAQISFANLTYLNDPALVASKAVLFG